MSNVDAAVKLVKDASSKNQVTESDVGALLKSINDIVKKSTDGEVMMIRMVTSEPLFRLSKRAQGDKKFVDSPPNAQ